MMSVITHALSRRWLPLRNLNLKWLPIFIMLLAGYCTTDRAFADWPPYPEPEPLHYIPPNDGLTPVPEDYSWSRFEAAFIVSFVDPISMGICLGLAFFIRRWVIKLPLAIAWLSLQEIILCSLAATKFIWGYGIVYDPRHYDPEAGAARFAAGLIVVLGIALLKYALNLSWSDIMMPVNYGKGIFITILSATKDDWFKVALITSILVAALIIAASLHWRQQ